MCRLRWWRRGHSGRRGAARELRGRFRCRSASRATRSGSTRAASSRAWRSACAASSRARRAASAWARRAATASGRVSARRRRSSAIRSQAWNADGARGAVTDHPVDLPVDGPEPEPLRMRSLLPDGLAPTPAGTGPCNRRPAPGCARRLERLRENSARYLAVIALPRGGLRIRFGWGSLLPSPYTPERDPGPTIFDRAIGLSTRWPGERRDGKTLSSRRRDYLDAQPPQLCQVAPITSRLH